MQHAQKGVFLREPPDATISSPMSSNTEELPNHSVEAFPACNVLTSVGGLERGESSKAIRYAKRTPEQIQARRERVRAHRQNLTPQEKEEINARRRERRQRLTLDEKNSRQRALRQMMTPKERQERNARRRARRQSITREEQQALLRQRNANYMARRDTPCKESIALQSPTNSSMRYPSSSTCTFSNPSVWTQLPLQLKLII